MDIFFPGLHHPADAKNFDTAFLSINSIRGRKKPIVCPKVVIDSGAFVELEKYGGYRHEVWEYALEIYRLWIEGVVRSIAVVAQDYMCEPFMLAKTGFDVLTHQYLTVERYIHLVQALTTLFGGPPPFHILPVLQGFHPEEYVFHLKLYQNLLPPNSWVGVGSVCKRQGKPQAIVDVLSAIKSVRPDLRLHGFGVKLTSLKNSIVRSLLYSADSMAWSYAARKQGRNQNDWKEAETFVQKIKELVA